MNILNFSEKRIVKWKEMTLAGVEVGKNIKIAVVKISNDNGYKKLLLDIIYINYQFVNDLSTEFLK